MKKTLILVTSPERADVYEYLLPFFDDVVIPVSKTITLTTKVKQVLYSDYKSPRKLIEEIKPDRIIFMEVFDLLQISLCVAANSLNIKTFFLEHGFTGEIKGQDKKNKKSFVKVLFTRIKSLPNKGISFFRNRMFYFSVWEFLSVREIMSHLKLYLWIEFAGNYFALRNVKFRKRVPRSFVLFNKNNESLREGLYHYQGYEDIEVHFTGLPYFNKYSIESNNLNQNNILFIDHPYYEVGILEWNEQFHAKYVNSIYSLANKKTELSITVKLHPLSDKKNWEKFKIPENVTIIQQAPNEVLNDIYEKAALIYSFSSTLLIGFLSNKRNVVLLGWSPKPKVEGWSGSVFAITHQSYSFADLKDHFKEWRQYNKAILEKDAYEEFLNYYNPDFDGNAIERIINIVSA